MASARRSPVNSGRLELADVVMGAALATFVLLGFASGAGLTRESDLRVRRKVRPRRNKRVTRVATAISQIGAPHMRLILAGSLALACRKRGRGRPSRIFAAALFATAVNRTSRLALHQARPPKAGVHHGLDIYAYPSGHCFAVAALMTAAVRELSKGESDSTQRNLAAGGIATALATGWSRLYLDEHWIDDVIGGLSAGLGVGIAVTGA